jgi:RNase P/RNase MRP subunit POP5
MSPGIGLMKRRLHTEKEAIPLAVSGTIKQYGISADQVKTLETKYDEDGGDWYVALGFNEKRIIVKMDSVQGTITEIKEI